MFLSLPYLWGDPAGRLAEMFAELLPSHPNLVLEQFRGEMFPSTALPWDYIPRWFAISQPPAPLLLGLLGLVALGFAAGGVFRRGAGARPGAPWGRGELRFGVLLAACFALPLVAFVLLRPNTYNDWRHFYFLHGPFCLLATFALLWLRQLPARGGGVAKRMGRRRCLRANRGGPGRRGCPDGADPPLPISLFQLLGGPENPGTATDPLPYGLLEHGDATRL